MPNVQNGIFIYNGAQYNTIGGDTEGQRNLISGNGHNGIYIDGANTSNNTVSGNYIGTNAGGSGSVGNAHHGFYLAAGAHHNTLGGDFPGKRNVISGNQEMGILLDGSNWNTISGNYLGTDGTGLNPLPNHGWAVTVLGSNNTIGGETPGERNIVSGNSSAGIHLFGGLIPSTLNFIKGNYIGLAADGITPLPNTDGIRIQGNVSQNTIGGTLPAQRNIISGNLQRGIQINGGDVDATNNVISGNYIGTDSSGRIAVGNQAGPLSGPAGRHQPDWGGRTRYGNLISGNQFVGIWLEGGPDICRFYTIKGNYIGTDYLGLNPLGNLDDGIYFGPVAQSNFVGPDNVIAFNGRDGVQVDTPTATGNLITRNRIFANGGLGIDLTNGGNSAIPAPNIQTTTFGSIGSIRIAVSACGGCAVQVFNSRVPDGEGEVYLGGGLADATGNYVLEVNVLPYPYLTATAADVRGTSEFSPVFTSTAYLLRLPMILR